MKIINDIIVFFVVLFVGNNLASHFSYNILLENKANKFMIFLQHPYLYIKNKGEIEGKK